MKICSCLEQVTFDKNNLFGKKFFTIGYIFMRNPYIKKLSISECEIKDDGAECIAQGIEWSHTNSLLTHLNLSANDITDEGGTTLATSLRSFKC